MNILDYVRWRGDVPFEVSPLNSVDALILSSLCYIDFGGLVGNRFFRKSISLKNLAVSFFSSKDISRRTNLGQLINPLTIDLLKIASSSIRFGNLSVSSYSEKTNLSLEEQFAAVTFTYKRKWNFVAFRGTDDTIVGWKEDFNLGYLATVPSQQDALIYLENAMNALAGKFYVAGHSKGGNLSLFSAVNIEENLQKRIAGVFDFDGPGFKKEFFKTKGYMNICKKVIFHVPEFSVVGMLFHHDDAKVVRSDERGLNQHDPLSWQVDVTDFEFAETTTDASKFIERTVNQWFESMKREECELLVETLFSVLKDSSFLTNTEISENKFEAVLNMVKSVRRIDKETVSNVKELVKDLIKTGIKQF